MFRSLHEKLKEAEQHLTELTQKEEKLRVTQVESLQQEFQSILPLGSSLLRYCEAGVRQYNEYKDEAVLVLRKKQADTLLGKYQQISAGRQELAQHAATYTEPILAELKVSSLEAAIEQLHQAVVNGKVRLLVQSDQRDFTFLKGR